MEDFGNYIFPELVFNDLRADTKEEAIRLLVDAVYLNHPEFAGDVAPENALQVVLDRENIQTTGLGNQMAFPHGRINGWKKFVVILGYCNEAIEFNSLDRQPVHFICLMLSPGDQPYIILKSMSSIIRFLNERVEINKLFRGKNIDEIVSVFRRGEIKTSHMVEAIDVMRPLKTFAKLNDSVEDVVKLMHLKKIDVLPVVDEEQKLRGQISCFNIFEYEIPEFFKQLHTVSFVRKIDPFEKYFKIKRDLKVKDLLKEECATVQHDATLVEIIFLLTVKGHPRLFVTKEKKLVGIIDRFAILDRILFF